MSSENATTVEEKVNNVEVTADSSSTKKRREEKIRKRDPKAWDNVFKTVSALPETEKFNAIAKKYSELYDEFRKASQNCQNFDRTCSVLQKEKEHIRSEQAKSILARSRLENLCRELQKQNKQIKEENSAKIKEEEERRREVAAKFQKTLDEVTSMMNENREKNFKLRDDNIDMSKKISELYGEFQKREEDIKRMAKQMDLEKQLAKATITKLEFELKAEKELWNKERSILKANLEQSETRNKQLLENVKSMEQHLSVYKGQYEDFESTLDKSNKIFDNCKSEMVKMSKQIVMLEKEVNNWKSKWQVSATSLIELSTTKQNQDIHLAAADKKIEQLQKLCRQLQVDRGNFLKLLKTNGIEPVSQSIVESTEKPPTPKERELSILKDSLRMLQDQLRHSLNTAGETSESIESRAVEADDTVTKEGVAHSGQTTEGKITETCLAQNTATSELAVAEQSSEIPKNKTKISLEESKTCPESAIVGESSEVSEIINDVCKEKNEACLMQPVSISENNTKTCMEENNATEAATENKDVAAIVNEGITSISTNNQDVTKKVENTSKEANGRIEQEDANDCATSEALHAVTFKLLDCLISEAEEIESMPEFSTPYDPEWIKEEDKDVDDVIERFDQDNLTQVAETVFPGLPVNKEVKEPLEKSKLSSSSDGNESEAVDVK